MTTRKQRDVEASLVRKGFKKTEGDHSYYTYHRAADEKKTAVFTKTSHGSTEIGSTLLGKMARQCRLSSKEFLRLVDCPLSRADYELALRGAGVEGLEATAPAPEQAPK